MFLVALLIALASFGLGVVPFAAQDQVHKRVSDMLGSPDAVTVRFEQVPSWKLLFGEIERVRVDARSVEFEGRRVSDLSAALGPIKPGRPIPADVFAEFDQTVIGNVQLPGLPDIGLEKVQVSFQPFSLAAEAVVMGFIRMPVAITGRISVHDGQLVLSQISGRVGDQDVALPDVPLFSPPPGWTIVTADPAPKTIRLQLRGHLTP